jgi:hypothetical protein
MIDLPFLEPVGPAEFEIRVESLDDLRPGAQSGLDCVCDGLLKGSPFVHDALGEDASAPEPGFSPRRMLKALAGAFGGRG